MSAIERLTEAVRYGDGSGVVAIGSDVLLKDAAAVDALYQAAEELLHEYEGEETEHGFPFNFALRDAHRSLAAAVRRVDGEA